MSSLSDADDDDDEEEDKPLASRMALKTAPDGSRTATSGKRSGKKMKSKGQTAPASMQPSTGREQAEMNGQPNGVHAHDKKVKLEEKLDESQLNRLATGVTVDATNAEVRCLTSTFPLSALNCVPACGKDRESRCHRAAQGHHPNNACRE